MSFQGCVKMVRLHFTVHQKINWVLNSIEELINFGLTGMNHLLGKMPLQARSVAQRTREIHCFPSLK